MNEEIVLLYRTGKFSPYLKQTGNINLKKSLNKNKNFFVILSPSLC